MIHFHYVVDVRNAKKHKACGMIASVHSVENDVNVSDAFYTLADMVQAQLAQRQDLPQAYYFTITQFSEIGRDDTTYRVAVHPEEQQPKLFEHIDGMMREYPEANDIGQRALDDLTRAVSTGDPLDINIVAELLGIKLEVLEQVAATESNLSAKRAERGEWIDWKGGELMPVDGAELVDVRWTNGDIDTNAAGNFRWTHDSEILNIESYRLANVDPDEAPAPKKQIGDTQAPILNGSIDSGTLYSSGDITVGGQNPVMVDDDLTYRSANAPYAKAVEQHYGGDTAAESGSSD